MPEPDNLTPATGTMKVGYGPDVVYYSPRLVPDQNGEKVINRLTASAPSRELVKSSL